MQRIDYSFIALKKIVIDSSGARVKHHKLGWERCLVVLHGDHVRIWKAGGILLNDKAALDEVKSDSEPLHEFNLRLVHVQKMTDQNAFCFHFTSGMERILIAPENSSERRIIEIWDEIFARAIRLSIFLDLCTTSKYLKSAQDSSYLSTEYDIFNESFVVDCKWPGFPDYRIMKLSLKMKPGWNDRRIVSKRCVILSNETSGKPLQCASISPLTSFYILSEVDHIIVLEGHGRYKLNDPKIAPFADRIIVKPAQPEDLPRLMTFLRDSFEIIFPNPNNSSMKTTTSLSSNIAMRPIDFINPDHETEFDFNDLVEPKPWGQISWCDLFSAYHERVVKNQKLSPKDFTKKLKSRGFCLKSQDGVVINQAALNRMSEASESEYEAQMQKMFWHHLNLVERK